MVILGQANFCALHLVRALEDELAKNPVLEPGLGYGVHVGGLGPAARGGKCRLITVSRLNSRLIKRKENKARSPTQIDHRNTSPQLKMAWGLERIHHPLRIKGSSILLREH